MTTLQSEDCQTNDLNDLFPMSIESLAFPLDNSMRIVFTGYYNGFNVEVRSTEEMALLYHMGCFGKGSFSRSKPNFRHEDNIPQIMRRRQYIKRNYWFKKFSAPEDTTESDLLLKDLDELCAKIASDVLYKEGPGINHAGYIVVVKRDNMHDDWVSILGHVRMANTTVKEVLIAEVTKSCHKSIKLPEDLSSYSVREVLLTRNIPVTINSDD